MLFKNYVIHVKMLSHPLFLVVSEWIENMFFNYPVVTRELFGAMGPMGPIQTFPKTTS